MLSLLQRPLSVLFSKARELYLSALPGQPSGRLYIHCQRWGRHLSSHIKNAFAVLALMWCVSCGAAVNDSYRLSLAILHVLVACSNALKLQSRILPKSKTLRVLSASWGPGGWRVQGGWGVRGAGVWRI